MKSDTLNFIFELRARLLRYVVVLVAVLLVATFFANQIYQFLSLPILHRLTEKQGLIATAVPAPFLIPFKSALMFSVFITMPFLLWQIWRFIAPALYQNEKKLLWLVLAMSTILFYVGMIFSYAIVLPLMFRFFIYIAPAGVEVKPDIGAYFNFIIQTFFAFGISFELPVAIMFAVWSDIISIEKLKITRPYVIVGAFIVGMLLTPPDVISQTLLAIPLWLLYELGLYLSKFVKKM